MNQSDKNLSGVNSVIVKDLVKKFGKFTAVDRISFSVKEGEVFGFLGPNGAGKSTTIRMLCGIITPTSGYGMVAGHDIFTESEKIKQSIGYMSQKFSLYEDMTPYENIRFYLGIYAVPKVKWPETIDWILDMTRLGPVKNRLTKELPPGWRQRLALGCALLHRPRIVFLDEPTSGVDPATRKRFWEFIREIAQGGVTIFVTTHYMDEAENCDRVVLINEGRIAAEGPPAKIISDIFPDNPSATLNDAFIALTKNVER
ncbi:MAG: ABC transporter ATP-binding protein [Deltaproteobacteria bacterium]|nr:MAG: ABC transporter ATP-binding protein [Deltaproteobacteria bacterium]RLB85964.1 MAG: ABC transporter ATP-binding protein [Deltaproteobacteria bacterium]